LTIPFLTLGRMRTKTKLSKFKSVKTSRVNVAFTRKGTFEMRGGACVDVDEPVDWDEVVEKARRLEFSEFIPTSMEYDEEEWEFDKID